MSAPKHESRREMILRALRIDGAVWDAALAAYERRRDLSTPAASRLAEFARGFASVNPYDAGVPGGEGPPCPICGAATRPVIARREAPDATPLVYARCTTCGHGVLSSGGLAADRLYADRKYYDERENNGVGYDDYAAERTYREAKGERLLSRLREASPRPVKTMLEVGSGFGFTRAAAERAGIATTGIDRNPHAAEAARRLYGFDTVVGDFSSVAAGIDATFDCILFQFVLEHLEDPIAVVRTAARLLAPGGSLMLIVPSMEALEIEAFGAAYRSFRSDHLHLFSRDSLRRTFAKAKLREVYFASECNMHLLSDVLSASELADIYSRGLGPDLLVVASTD